MPFMFAAFSNRLRNWPSSTVIAARLLLLAKLEAVADDFRLAIFAVLAGSEVALFDRALLGVAALPFQEQLHALAPAKPADGTDISSQMNLPIVTSSTGAVYGSVATFVLLT